MAKFDTTSAPSLDKARELGESCDGVLFHDRHEDEVNASRIAKMGKRLLELDGEVENGGENGAFRLQTPQFWTFVDRILDVGRSIVQLWSCAVKSRHGFWFVEQICF